MEKSDPKRPVPSVRPPAPAPISGNPSAPPAKAASGPSSGGARASVPSPSARPWTIRKRGATDVQSCADLVTLRKWMLERRITRDDEISRSGKSFRRIGSIVEFESLFHSVDMERAEKRRATGQMPIPVLPPTPAAQPPRTGPPPAAAVSPPATGPGAARTEPPALDKLHVSPAGLTPNSGGLSPLRMTPSGQPSRPRSPSSPSIPAVPPTTARPAAVPASIPITPGRKDAPSAPATASPLLPPRKEAPAPAAAAPPPPPRKEPEPPRREPPAPPPTPAVRKEPPPPVAVAAPQAVAAAKPAADDDDESSAQPTTRFTRLDAPRPAPAPAAAVVPPAAPTSSGSQSVAFERTEPEKVAAEPRLATPPRPPRSERPAPNLPDPIEDAITRNDPVPRHLKESADPDRTARISASVDNTERFERKESRRGLLLFAASLMITAVLVLALQHAGKPDNPTPGGENATPPGPSAGVGEQPQNPPTPTPTPSNTESEPKTPPASTAPAVPAPEPKTPTAPTAPAQPTAKPTAAPTPPAAPSTASPPSTSAAVKPAQPSAPAPTATTAVKPAQPPAPVPTTATAPAKPPTPPAPTPAPANPTTTAAAKPPTPTNPTASTPPKPAANTGSKKIVVTEFPKTFDEQMDLAQRLVEHEQFDEAQRLFETIMGYAAHVPAVHVGLGKCALEQGRTDEAISHYKNALTRLSTYGPAIFGLGKAYRAKGDKEQAITWFKKYLELNQNGAAATVARDTIAKLEGQPPPPKPEPSELVKPPAQTQPKGGSELVKPQ